MLQLRNTPDPDCNVSPAQILFGRPLRDGLRFANRLEKFSNPHIRPIWRDAWAAKEEALRTRMTRTTESLAKGSRPLPPLSIGDQVFLQNQQGAHPNKWDRSGRVVEVLNNDQYGIKVDGTGRVTRRNRRFLRAYKPATVAITPRPVSSTACPARATFKGVQPDAAVTPDPPVPDPLPDQQPVLPATSVPSVTESEGCLVSPDREPAPKTHGFNPTAPAPIGSPPQRSPARLLVPRRQTRPPKRYEPETGLWV